MTVVSRSACWATTTRWETSRRWPTTCAWRSTISPAPPACPRRGAAGRASVIASPIAGALQRALSVVERSLPWDADSYRARGECASRSPRSTPPSATSPATRPRCASSSRARARPGRSSRSSPSWRVTGYPPEDLLLKEHFLADARAAVERIAADAQGIVALVGFPERADDAYNAAAVLADGARAGHLPQGQPAQLRGLRRAALLPARARRGDHRRRRRQGRPHHLRGHLGPRSADDRRGAGRRAAGAQHLGLALPGRQGPPARADDRPARPRQPRRGRLLRARRRPGRAGLRRPLVRRRPRRQRDRPRAAVRRGAPGVRRRRRGRGRRAPARHPRAARGARGGARGGRPRVVLDRGRLGRGRPGRPGAPSCSTTRPRSTRRSCSARATT